jgi:acetyl-CoA C-acetyltransferase
MLGCGLPAASPASTWPVVNTLLGLDTVPGATITRYCSSSVQTTRMALHAIKAGEGDVFVSAGVETVSRFGNGTSDIAGPDTRTRSSPTPGPHRGDAAAATTRGPTRASTACARRLHRDGPDRGERRHARGASPPGARRVRVRSQNLAEKAIADGFWAREITPVTTPDGTVVSTDDGPRAGVTSRRWRLKPVFRPTAPSPPATAARSTTAPPPS